MLVFREIKLREIFDLSNFMNINMQIKNQYKYLKKIKNIDTSKSYYSFSNRFLPYIDLIIRMHAMFHSFCVESIYVEASLSQAMSRFVFPNP